MGRNCRPRVLCACGFRFVCQLLLIEVSQGIEFLDLDFDHASFAEGNMPRKNSQKADDLPFACTLDFTVGAYSFLMS
jgi:hypothetical protein